MDESEVAIVTGGAQGIGAAICVILLKKGYKVCVSDIQEEKGKNFVTQQRKLYGANRIEFVAGDVTKEDDYEGIFEFTLKAFKRIDLVINNAGILKENNVRLCVDVNLVGPIIGCRLALKYMGKSNGGRGGLVINTASLAGFLPFHNAPVYAATKHGVVGLTRSFGHPYNLEKDGVLFAALCPSFVDTELKCDINKLNPKFLENTELLHTEYVAEGVLKLLEDRINGSTLLITKDKGYQYVGCPEGLST